MWRTLWNLGKAAINQGLAWLEQQVQQWTKPTDGSAVLETVSDLLRGKAELVLENALLRQQVIVLKRSVKRPKVNNTDRRVLVILASRLRGWRSALLVVKPATV